MPRLEMIAMVAIVGSVLSAAQRLAPEAQQPRTWRSRAWDGVFIAQYLLLLPLVGIVTAVVIVGADSTVPIVASWPFLPRVTVALLGVDLALYLLHRAAHRFSWLWRFHAVHHRPTEVGWPVTFRVHLAESAIHQTLPYAAVASLGVGTDALAFTVGFVMVVSILAHTNVWVSAGWFERVVATPRFHRTHHEVGHDSSNFAVLFPVLDMVFGSADFTERETREFGIEPGYRNRMAPIPNDATLATPLTVAPSTSSPNSRL